MLTTTDLDRILNKFIDNEIRLTKKDIEASAKSRDWVLEKIKSKINSLINQPSLYGEEPFVKYGSYFTGVQVADVDEFDVLVVIDSCSGVFSKPAGTPYGDGLGTASPNHKYDDDLKKSDQSGVSPTKLLNWLQSVVADVAKTYGGEAPEKDGQAITLNIKGSDIRIDLVPAGIFRRKSDGSIFYNIPNGKKDNGWILTNPKLDAERIKRIASAKDGFKNIIRIHKYLRTKYNFKIKSYAIQTNISDYAEASYWWTSLFDNFLACLKNLKASVDRKNIPDGYDSSVNLLADTESLDYYSERLSKIITSLESLKNETDSEVAYQKLCYILSNGEIGKLSNSQNKASTLLSQIFEVNNNQNSSWN